MKKYLTQFRKIYKIATGKRFQGEAPSIRHVILMLKRDKRRIVSEFLEYLENKTHLSYDVFHAPRPSAVRNWKTKEKWIEAWEGRSDRQACRWKLSEFIILILAEYVILHNYMWGGGIRPKEVKTIDAFLRPMD